MFKIFTVRRKKKGKGKTKNRFGEFGVGYYSAIQDKDRKKKFSIMKIKSQGKNYFL